jgi:hydroxymethylglutaryl-CoA lyase
MQKCEHFKGCFLRRLQLANACFTTSRRRHFAGIYCDLETISLPAMSSKPHISLVECPRDAMQGWDHFIPTEKKISYLNQLLKVGFDVLDCGSFVSPKAIPQMADTKEVLPQLNLDNTKSKLLVIIANEKGANDAVTFEQVNYLGYPFSISETFQKLNTNASIQESLTRVEAIQNLCVNNKKEMLVYISMGFGNPYGDEYSPEVAIHWVEKLSQLGIKHFALADTVGVSNPQNIEHIFNNLIPAFPQLKIGAHFHTTSTSWQEKLDAAHKSGCISYDGAIRGIGGCPMAQNDLVGNMDMSNLIQYFDAQGLDMEAYQKAVEMSWEVFV